jgi:CBS domain-containing protein
MIVKNAMSRHVTLVYPSTSIREIWKLIFSKKINAVPVVDARNRLQGIIAKDDLLTILYPNYEEYITDFTSASDFDEMEKKIRNIGQKTASDVMKRRVIYTWEETPLMRALSRMIVRHVDQLPVLSEGNKVVGMITKGDIFGALFKHRLSVSFRKK